MRHVYGFKGAIESPQADAVRVAYFALAGDAYLAAWRRDVDHARDRARKARQLIAAFGRRFEKRVVIERRKAVGV